MLDQLFIETNKPGLIDITQLVQEKIRLKSDSDGLCTIFIQHTSASLIIQENADPSARRDIENWITRFVPENDSLYTHVSEGSDDMPAHIKSMLTASSLSIPIMDGKLALGTWQGIYLFEHRVGIHRRKIILHCLAD